MDMNRPQPLSPVILVIGLGSILLVSGCAWAGTRLSSVPPAVNAPAAVNAPERADAPASEPAAGKIAIAAKKGEAFRISLEGNITTGYSWTAKFDDRSLELVEQKYVESGHEPDLVGAGGADNFTFRGLKTGRFEINFGYARPWEKGIEPVKTAVYEVTIQ